MLITLIRHAQILECDQGRYIGHTNSPLSEFGHSDAKKFASYFIQHNQNNYFDALYCSDLIRCQQTLAPLLLTLNNINKPSPALKPTFLSQIREKYWGKHEAMSFDEICTMENSHYKNFEQWMDILDGETVDEFILRIKKFLHLLSQTQDKNILIMTHSGVIRTCIYLLSQLEFEQSFHLSIPYASFVVLTT